MHGIVINTKLKLSVFLSNDPHLHDMSTYLAHKTDVIPINVDQGPDVTKVHSQGKV